MFKSQKTDRRLKGLGKGLCLSLLAVLAAQGQRQGAAITFSHAALMRKLKVDNGVTIGWTPKSVDNNAVDVEVRSLSGNLLNSLKVLGSIDGAQSVSIYDVAASTVLKKVAVAAVAVSRSTPTKISDLLLIYSWNGALQQAVTLDPSREIFKLEIDNNGDIWALGNSSGTKDPAKVPLISHFNEMGAEIGTVLARSLYPKQSAILNPTEIAGGDVGFGLNPDFVWLWMPGYTSLVKVSTLDGVISKMSTGLPEISDSLHVFARQIVALPDGALVMDIGWITPDQQRHSRLFSWTAAERWKALMPLSGEWLVGASGDDIVMGSWAGRDSSGHATKIRLRHLSLDEATTAQ